MDIELRIQARVPSPSWMDVHCQLVPIRCDLQALGALGFTWGFPAEQLPHPDTAQPVDVSHVRRDILGSVGRRSSGRRRPARQRDLPGRTHGRAPLGAHSGGD